MSKYYKYNYIVKNYQISKFNNFNNNNILDLSYISVNAGHFKPSSVYVEHGLILSNISFSVPKVKLYKHGKRQKNTIELYSNSSSYIKWNTLDNILNMFLPLISDIKQMNFKRQKFESLKYSWRIRSFFEWDNLNILLSERVLKKQIFLPLNIDIKLKTVQKQSYNIDNYIIEQTMRMYKLPIEFKK
jgi:hypothetical protein